VSSPSSNTAGQPPGIPHDGAPLVALDPWLAPYAGALARRCDNYRRVKNAITLSVPSLADFATGHHYLGFTRGTHLGKPGLWYREWAPGAARLSLIGDFNNWDRAANPMLRDTFGVWALFLPDDTYASRLTHDSGVKVHVLDSHSKGQDRIPAYIRRVTFDPDGSNATGRLWLPPTFQFQHANPVHTAAPRIYEAHIGMALEAQRVGTFAEFSRDVLPRIARAGYNCVQLMAVQEHPYYGSFGYHVSNFFAVSSRFGQPEDFKRLVDAAHALGLKVFLDLVHSHAVKNTVEGLNALDGTDHHYFHAPPRAIHPAWDSMLFDYSKHEVLRFLLSNVRFWLEEFRVDGFRFDGVTSMLYHDHGLGKTFTCYDDYFGPNIDHDAGAYLALATEVAHAVKPDAVCIAEDVSGMVGIARPVREGGFGFDYRLAMGIPDYWIKLLKERPDEAWSMGELFHTLSNRRDSEKHIAYAESHDQALVGDKTLAFRLMDSAMYTHMNKASQSLVIDRGLALHKLIRLLTFFVGGEGWLNFMGNEFGHPEWVDFPRQGNDFSYKYARRQWSLADNPDLHYEQLARFDLALQQLDEQHHLLTSPRARLMQCDELGKRIVAERANLILAVNLHPAMSFTDWRIGVPGSPSTPTAAFTSILDTDAQPFGGHALVTPGHTYPAQAQPWDEMKQSVQIYVPARSGQIVAARK